MLIMAEQRQREGTCNEDEGNYSSVLRVLNECLSVRDRDNIFKLL